MWPNHATDTLKYRPYLRPSSSGNKCAYYSSYFLRNTTNRPTCEYRDEKELQVVLVFALAHQISVICTLYISIAQPTPRAIMAEQMQGVLPASAIQSSVSPELAVMAPAPVNPSATPAAENIQSPASAPPEQVSETLYIQNLNERVKLDGKTSLILLILPASSRR